MYPRMLAYLDFGWLITSVGGVGLSFSLHVPLKMAWLQGYGGHKFVVPTLHDGMDKSV